MTQSKPMTLRDRINETNNLLRIIESDRRYLEKLEDTDVIISLRQHGEAMRFPAKLRSESAEQIRRIVRDELERSISDNLLRISKLGIDPSDTRLC